MVASGCGGPEAPPVNLGDPFVVKNGFLDVSESTDHRQASDPTHVRQTKEKWEALEPVRIDNIPDTYDLNMLVTLLKKEGFDCVDCGLWTRKINGHPQVYAVVKLLCPLAARRLLTHFHGFHNWGMGIEGGQPAVTSWCPERTVMLKHIHEACDRDMLVTLFNNEGFRGEFDFVYRPYKVIGNEVTDTPLGYAVVNLRCPLWALKFKMHFDGFKKWGYEGGPEAVAKWYHEHGQENHIVRYKDSPIMHTDVPDTKKPTVFHDGIPIPFPSPSRPVPPPNKQKRRGHKRRPQASRSVGDTSDDTTETSQTGGWQTP